MCMTINDALSVVHGQNKQQQLLFMRSRLASACPNVLKALQIIEVQERTQKTQKGYNLVKRENKKFGFVYYVRYSHNGKMLPSKWNTHTNVLSEAETFARNNKERLVSAYNARHDKNAFAVLEHFFDKDSAYFLCETKRNRPLCERHRQRYSRVITTKFIPFLKERNIKCLAQIDVHVLADFQDRLLSQGLKPQTVNWNLNAITRVFKYLARKNIIPENPCTSLNQILANPSDRQARGCHELEKLPGVFGKAWTDEMQYLLCLIIYATGMRNIEIMKIALCDIIEIDGCRFIDIKASKTRNGVRLVPLHDAVYKKIKAFYERYAKRDDEYIFCKCQTRHFANANSALGAMLGIRADELKAQNITFYSGRHFWKTMMNSEGLGDDIEEVFMGHSVSGDVAKLYNHKDKQGKKRMVAKARQVFTILDECLF
ncbi:MAG: hypothetical protein Ta2A_07860 [Treponemataceae bacterium]|nr:MAG: hypothetical protein Ta2A_07860 [Treponemataceae bacterium]